VEQALPLVRDLPRMNPPFAPAAHRPANWRALATAGAVNPNGANGHSANGHSANGHGGQVAGDGDGGGS
ncbi:hypothetical protein M8C17_31710, partial [Micromonospora sp. RHAY321]|uniref:hypothetical protein n=1 Tax=Micromonospora sp. RHAY321 TaxID=2944807 RepID=UPI00207CF3D3